MRFAHLIAGLALALALTPKLVVADEPAKLRQESIAAMEQAAKYYHDRLASHGGYVYFYSLDTGSDGERAAPRPTRSGSNHPARPLRDSPICRPTMRPETRST